MASNLTILDPVPPAVLDVSRPAALATLERRVLAPARKIGLDLEPFGITRVPAHNEQIGIVTDARGRHWSVSAPMHDPTMERGLIPVPQVQLDKLHRMKSAGVEPDYLYIAHELPSEWKRGDPIPKLVPPAPRIAASERLLLRTVGALKTTFKAVAIGMGIALAAPISLVGLDPMILGGVLSDDGQAVAWTILTSWRWDD